MLVTGSQKTTVLKGTTFVDTLLGWGVRQNADGSVTEDITKVAHESMFGNSGNDKLYGGAGNDKLYGEVGNDILNGGSGNDYLDGGSGIDTAVFKSSIGTNGTEKVLFQAPAEPVFFNWVNGKLTVTTSEGVDTLVNIENLQFAGQTFKITDVPIANNDTIAATENLLNVAASALLANDFSAMAGGPPLAIQTGFSGVVGQTTEGVNIYLGGDGRLHFADGETAYDYLAQGETLTTHFSYTIANGTGLTDTADVTLTIAGQNDAPIAGEISLFTSMAADTPFTISEKSLLHFVTDTDVNDITHAVSGVSDPDGCTADLQANGVNVSLLSSNSTPGDIQLFGDGRLVNGLGGTSGFGENYFYRNDDSSMYIDVTTVFASGLNFGDFGTVLSLSNNGYLHTDSWNSYIRPFGYDVDTRSGTVTPTPGGNSTGTNLVWYDLDPENGVFTATWDDVGRYSFNNSALNAFQVQLYDRANGDFDIVFRYEDLNYTGGDAFLYSNGGEYEYRLPYGLAYDSLAGNVDIGVWGWSVRDGVVSELNGAGFNYTVEDAAGATGEGRVSIYQSADSSIDGNDGANILVGAEGNDTLTGGAGDDIFVFYTGSGQDTVTDFTPGAGTDDLLDLTGVTGIYDFAGVLSHAYQVGGDTVIAFGGGDQITLLGVSITALNVDDFLV